VRDFEDLHTRDAAEVAAFRGHFADDIRA